MRGIFFIQLLGVAWILELARSQNEEKDCFFVSFYYLWYGNPKTDGRWMHWNHSVLPHWDKKIQSKYDSIKDRALTPPEELHSPFRPLHGAYSVIDPDMVKITLREVSNANVDVLALSWWGIPSVEDTADSQGVNTDDRMDKFLEIVLYMNKDRQGSRLLNNVQFAFHLEPYHGRSINSVAQDVSYLKEKYMHNSLMYKDETGRLLIFVYDSYHIKSSEWARLLKPDGDLHHLAVDCAFIGLWLDEADGRSLFDGGFHGAYTYFVSPMGYGSKPENWKAMNKYLAGNDMKFFPSVGPGYNDEKIRPWNAMKTIKRNGVKTYDTLFLKAIETGVASISITSYNEWGEGTQIETAEDYAFNDPYLYTKRTKYWKQKCRQGLHEKDEL